MKRLTFENGQPVFIADDFNYLVDSICSSIKERFADLISPGIVPNSNLLNPNSSPFNMSFVYSSNPLKIDITIEPGIVYFDNSNPSIFEESIPQDNIYWERGVLSSPYVLSIVHNTQLDTDYYIYCIYDKDAYDENYSLPNKVNPNLTIFPRRIDKISFAYTSNISQIPYGAIQLGILSITYSSNYNISLSQTNKKYIKFRNFDIESQIKSIFSKFFRNGIYSNQLKISNTNNVIKFIKPSGNEFFIINGVIGNEVNYPVSIESGSEVYNYNVGTLSDGYYSFYIKYESITNSFVFTTIYDPNNSNLFLKLCDFTMSGNIITSFIPNTSILGVIDNDLIKNYTINGQDKILDSSINISKIKIPQPSETSEKQKLSILISSANPNSISGNIISDISIDGSKIIDNSLNGDKVIVSSLDRQKIKQMFLTKKSLWVEGNIASNQIIGKIFIESNFILHGFYFLTETVGSSANFTISFYKSINMTQNDLLFSISGTPQAGNNFFLYMKRDYNGDGYIPNITSYFTDYTSVKNLSSGTVLYIKTGTIQNITDCFFEFYLTPNYGLDQTYDGDNWM